MKINKNLAETLVRAVLGRDFQFFITGSVVLADSDPQDIDFVLLASDFRKRLVDAFDWVDNPEYEGTDAESYKVTIDGVIFNAIVVSDEAVYNNWRLATLACSVLPPFLRGASKDQRVAVFEAVKEALAGA